MPVKSATKKAAPRKRPAAKRAAATQGVSDSQKKAMAQGRQESAAVRQYLEALRAENTPKKRGGRRLTPEAIQQRIGVLEEALGNGVDPIREAELRQERLMLQSELQAKEPKVSSETFADGFVKAVKSFSERRGITYDVWREMNVPVTLLQKAGMKRGS